MYPEEHYAVRVLRGGAAGYLTKSSAPDELISAIRRVSSGRKYISTSLAERLTYELDRDALRYEIAMAAVGAPMTHHLSAELQRD